jgi:hypothetical protein
MAIAALSVFDLLVSIEEKQLMCMQAHASRVDAVTAADDW